MDRLSWILIAALVAWGAWHWLWQRPMGGVAAPPVDITLEPRQEALDAAVTVKLDRGGHPFIIQQTHRYEVQGRVLSAEHYDLTWTNDFFDVDLGLIWGGRIQDLLERFDFSQDGRFLFWRSSVPVSEEDQRTVTRSIGNEHLIPQEGNRRIAKAIRWAGKGDLVRVRGYLVIIRDSAWQELASSSTSRDDSGPGACEIVWVDEIQIGGKVYR